LSVERANHSPPSSLIEPDGRFSRIRLADIQWVTLPEFFGGQMRDLTVETHQLALSFPPGFAPMGGA